MPDDNNGWVCPVCHKVFAPTVKMCKKCSKQLKESEQLLEE